MQSSFTVEKITRDQIPAVAEVERECFADPWSEGALSMLTEEPNVGFFVACDGRIVGYCGMQCVLDEGQVTDIAVLPSYRRRGIAAALLDTLISHAHSAGLRVIFLEVRESNLPALSLYRDRFGFEILGGRRGFYSHPKEDALNMRLLLSDNISLSERTV